MSWTLQNQVCANADQGLYKSASQFAVMRALASFADDDGERCFPSLAALAARSQCNERTVQRVLKKFRRNNWIAVKRTGRSNQYRILEHGCVAPPEREVTVTPQRRQDVVSETTKCPIRDDTVSDDSYQVTTSNKSDKNKKTSPAREGVVVVFDEDEEKVTKEKTPENASALREQLTSHSFVTPFLGKKGSGGGPSLQSATRGGHPAQTAMQCCACGEDHPDGMPSLEEIYLELQEIYTGSDEEWRLEQESWGLHDIWLSTGFQFNGHPIRNWKAALRSWMRHKG